jgi:hypothetical protein
LIRYFNLFIENNKCFIYIEDGVKRLTKKDYIISLRNYFYNWLYESLNYFTNLIIPDRENIFKFDKLSVLNKILLNSDYSRLKKIYGDVSIIFVNNKNNIKYIVSKLVLKYDKFVIKDINSEMGEWVYTFDKNSYSFYSKIYNFLERKYLSPLLVFPYFDLGIEYRIYYSYFNDKINIYSTKIKENNNLDEAFEKWSFHMYKNLDVTRDIFDKNNFTLKELNFIKEIIKLLWWNVWVMEFIKTKTWELYLMEVNHLWWLLLYDMIDIDNLNKFYQDIYSNLIY